MLYVKTVEPNAFSVLNQLMKMPALENFSLVGGTALSLMYGHRKSVDLDLFSVAPWKNEIVIEALKKIFADKFLLEEKPPQFGIFCYIDGVKIDLVRHPHPLIRPVDVKENIRMFSAEDIIAMKVQAILGRGKKKDFWDVAELLKHFTVADFVRLHKEKYSTQNLLITVPQAITYFADADDGEDPVSLKKQNWESVKNFINKKVSDYLK